MKCGGEVEKKQKKFQKVFQIILIVAWIFDVFVPKMLLKN